MAYRLKKYINQRDNVWYDGTTNVLFTSYYLPEGKEIVDKIELFNSNGVKMKTFDRLTINKDKIRIETGDLQSGMYFIQIESNGIIESKKFIIVD